MRKQLSVLLSTLFILSYAQKKDTITSKDIKEVVIQSKMNVRQKDGKFEVSVAGTNFQKMPDSWEGLKLVPMLRATDGQPLKVNNKTATVEINGIRTQMDAGSLESYLKSLDPKSIKKIEINYTPDASYGTEVEAVVNIIMSNPEGNYRLGINTTNGVKQKFYEKYNANYAVNGKKLRFYASYNFSDQTTINKAIISQQIGNTDLLRLNYHSTNLDKSHVAFMNLNWSFTPKDQLDLTAVGEFSRENTAGDNYNDLGFNREIDLRDSGQNVQFAEVWKHQFNDSVSVKVGTYQVLNFGKSRNSSDTNGQQERQYIQTKTPLYIGFVDYKNKNKWGSTSLGARFHSIDVTNNNRENGLNSPFLYDEKVLAFYLNHSIEIAKNKSLSLGVRSETTATRYSFEIPEPASEYHNKDRYTSLLYNASYNWTTEAKRMNTIAFRKQIQRPNYSYLNPFQSISNNITYFSGDSNVEPAKYYSLTLQTYKKGISVYTQLGLIKDFISSFFEAEDDHIVQTYKNFESVKYVAGGVEYNHGFFNDRWTTKTSVDITYFKLKDKAYSIERATPQTTFRTINTINLGDDFTLTPQYYFIFTNRDGLLKHHGYQKLDLTLSKKINRNFTVIAFAYDIFKTAKSWTETTVPNYYYSSEYFSTSQTFGLSVWWSLTGKTYKGRAIDQPEGSEINRLGK